MDHGTYALRPFADVDYDDLARINNAIWPDLPSTAEEERHWDQLVTRTPGRRIWRFAAVDRRSGLTVGWGGVGHTMWNYHPRKFFVRAVVDPAYRGRGVGRELYAVLEATAREQHAVSLWSSAREDEAGSVRFLERQGFVPVRKTWFSRLDLTALDLSKFPDRSAALAERGIRFTTLAAKGADRPDVRRRLYELSRITAADVPRVGEYTPATYDEFVDIELVNPRVLPEAIFLACGSEEYVGWTTLQRVPGLADTLDIGFTGTLPNHRGRGIASELKRRAVAHARGHGYRFLITANDSLNPRIWAINEKLGFRREVVMLQAEKTLGPSPG